VPVWVGEEVQAVLRRWRRRTHLCIGRKKDVNLGKSLGCFLISLVEAGRAK